MTSNCVRCNKSETVFYKPVLGDTKVRMCKSCIEKDVTVYEYKEPNNKCEHMLVTVSLSSIDLRGKSLDSFIKDMLEHALEDYGYDNCKAEVRDATYDDEVTHD